jgi:hypothetical protein
MLDPGADIFYEDGLRNVLEDHMTYLRGHKDTQIMAVDPMQVYVHKFDLIGLLNVLRIPMYLHWVVMRMNKIDTFTQVPSDLTQLLVPSTREVSMIQQTYTTTYRITN